MPVAPGERLFIAVFSFGEDLHQLVNAESDRLIGVCRYASLACFSKHFSPIRRSVAVLRSGPSETSSAIGAVHALVKLSGEEYGGLAIGLDVELLAETGRFRSWLENIGDWGYGIYVSGVRPRGTWVQLFGAPFPAETWLSSESPSFAAHVEPITGSILSLQSVRATFPDGSRRRIPDGAYLITRSTRSAVAFRAEVPSDMACGEPISPPRRMPPILRTIPDELFDVDGSPRFAVVYQKGC
jgi:hypothetical protein